MIINWISALTILIVSFVQVNLLFKDKSCDHEFLFKSFSFFTRELLKSPHTEKGQENKKENISSFNSCKATVVTKFEEQLASFKSLKYELKLLFKPLD